MAFFNNKSGKQHAMPLTSGPAKLTANVSTSDAVVTAGWTVTIEATKPNAILHVIGL